LGQTFLLFKPALSALSKTQPANQQHSIETLFVVNSSG